MAIVFDCPLCKHHYELKDEYAGRKATCKNPACRQQITIPKPPSAAELEAAALSALADDVAKDVETPAVERTIAMDCNFCGHQWAEPLSKAGKNVLCPNPECRQRLRVPEPKDDGPIDWRQKRTKLPEGAKQNFEKLEGVQDAADSKYVASKSLQEADATGIEYEPRPLKQKILFVLVPLLLIGAIGYGGCYLSRRSSDRHESQLMADAVNKAKETFEELPATQKGLYVALLHGAAAEFVLRQNDSKKLKEAHDSFVKARGEMNRVPPGPERNAVLAELALVAVAFGGTDEQVKEQIRFRWLPDINSQNVRPSEATKTIHAELNTTLNPLQQTADFDFKLALARRLARELTKKGQADFAVDYIPLFLFNDAEKDEARAAMALEIFKADKASAVAARVANDLKSKGIKSTPSGSAQTLLAVLGLEPIPAVPTSNPSETLRLALVGRLLLENSADEARRVAMRPGQPEHQFKALVLCAEWSDAGAAADLALDVIAASKTNPNVRLSQSQILRIAQLAAGAGKDEQARKLADWLSDEGLKVWAKGDSVRYRVEATPTQKAEESWAELPPTVDKLRAGHAWGRFWVARQNSRLSGDWKAEKKTTDGWPLAPIQPFALAGIALGLKDQ